MSFKVVNKGLKKIWVLYNSLELCKIEHYILGKVKE